MITFEAQGDFSHTLGYLDRAKEFFHKGLLDKYGEKGVAALAHNTPKKSGITSNSWYYKIEHSYGSASINFYNKSKVNGVPIAIIVQYGHGNGTGGWVEGIDYINPALKPVFEEMLEEIKNGGL